MFGFLNFGLFGLIGLGLWALEGLILARVVLSFVPSWARTPWGRLISLLTEPLLRPIRKKVSVNGPGFGIDFSPMIVLFAIHLVRQIF